LWMTIFASARCEATPTLDCRSHLRQL